MLVAAAAMAFTSCQKEETAAPETVSATLTMHAGVEQTKTYLDENNAVLWGKDEAVTLYVGAGETAKFFDSASTDAYDGEASASFTFAIEDVAQADSYALGGIYPASAAMDDNTDATKFKTILPQTQNAEVGKYDPSAYIMVLKPEIVKNLPEQYQASFRRATALNKITLTGVKEDIASVEITVPEGMAFAGRRYFDLTDGKSGDIYYGQSNTITVNSQFAGESIDVWFCSWGVELEPGQELTVRMKNADKSFTRTIQANEKGIKFVEGDLNTLKINMQDAIEESLDSFAGEWLITGTTGGVTYAAGAYVNGKNNLNDNIAITVENDVIAPVDGLENCKMLFTEITEGDYKGMYTIQDVNGNYLYAAASGSNHLKATASASSAHYYWTVECNDGKYSVVASKSTNRNVMQFNPNNGSPIFSCYASATQTALVLYPYSMVKVDTTPKIVISGETTKNVVFGGETVKFNYLLKYLDGENLTWVVSDKDMVSDVTDEDGVLAVTVSENEGEARTATITLSCGDAEEVVLTINQAKYVDPSVIQKLTVDEFAELEDGNTVYELTGTITGIYQEYNSSYNNISFYLKDDSRDEAIIIFRMSCEGIDYNKVAVGNVITVQGPKGNHNGVAQMAAGGKCISIVEATAAPSISFENNTVTITAVSGASIYYTLDGSVPTTSSTKYIAPFAITATATVKAIAVENGKPQSAAAELLCKFESSDPDAGDPVEYTLLFGANYNSNKISSYTATWSATNNGFKCNLTNWNNNNNGWSYVKAGRKNNASVATITTAAAVTEALTTVTMTVDEVTTTKINSLKLYVSSDANFTTKDTYTATAAKGNVVFNISNPVANAYYKIEVDCASGSLNGLIQVSKVVYAN